jgi:hypothetical protein
MTGNSHLSQCSHAVFEGLLPEPHDKMVAELLFELATWHAFAKLRLHTESTLQSFEASTSRLGQILRRFCSTTCEAFHTQELPSEEAARGRRRATNRNPSSKKHFNLQSFKPHALGHYVEAIRMFGTTDSYSTQLVRQFTLYFMLLTLSSTLLGRIGAP